MRSRIGITPNIVEFNVNILITTFFSHSKACISKIALDHLVQELTVRTSIN